MAVTQKELNNRIAIELDKHCIQNEYGYLLLDQDKAIRDKYKWCLNLSVATWIDLGVTVLSAIFGLVSDLNWLLYIAAALAVIFVSMLAIRYFHRKEISKLLNEKQRNDLSDLLEKHSEYVDNLREWFMDLGADKKTERKRINEISALFKSAFQKGNRTYNSLSKLFGPMQDELHQKAAQKAVAKLSPLLQFHIK